MCQKKEQIIFEKLEAEMRTNDEHQKDDAAPVAQLDRAADF